VPSPARILASLEAADRGTRFDLVGELGRIRVERRRDGLAFYLDFRPYGRLWSHQGIRIRDEATARRVLEAIRAKVADGLPLEEALASFAAPDAQERTFGWWYARWLVVKRREADAGERSPTYVRDLDYYGRPGGYLEPLGTVPLHALDYGVLEDFSLELAGRGLSTKSRRNVLGAVRSCLGWLKRRGELRDLPEFPWPKVEEYEPRLISVDDQDRILAAIPEIERGVFLALALLGLRPGEARALEVSDYRDGWLVVDKGMKGASARAPIRGTKTGRPKRLPVPVPLADWIARHVSPSSRLRAAPLFVNPRTGIRWSHWAIREHWLAAAAAVGLEGVRLYEGTKHSMATDALRRGVSERALQAFLGHSDVRSTRRYARLADLGLVTVLRAPMPKPPTPFVGGLSVDGITQKYVEWNQRVRASPTGIEPVLPP